MLTRLKVRGFKNLLDVDVRFGPFTCIAGLNGVGKSNLFDAILFASSLADETLLEAVTRVRRETRSTEAGRVFSRLKDRRESEIHVEVEMLVPPQANDDLEQEARASITGLRYSLSLRLHTDTGSRVPRIELTREQLDYIRRGEARTAFPFAKGCKQWLESAFTGRRTSPFISTECSSDGTFIKVHEDSGHQGRTRKLRAETLARTVLSTINTAESPTALVVRRELQSWKLLQLEPARLRAPDELRARSVIQEDGAGLAATVYRLLQGPEPERAATATRLTNRLAELLENVRDVDISVDEQRELITLLVRGADGIQHRARDLSDGTLRFLALAVLEHDSQWSGTLCMEEPENGIHPVRLPAMIRLLQSLAVDTSYSVGDDNPLRQVIVNTHSPEVVALVPDDSLLFAVSSGSLKDAGLELRPLPGTWRHDDASPAASRGQVIEMLNATTAGLREAKEEGKRAVGLRPDIEQLLLPGLHFPG